MHRKRYNFWLLFFFLYLLHDVKSNTTHNKPSLYNVVDTQFGYNNFIKKDSKGYIWISSIKGAYKYNGTHTKYYKLELDENIQSSFYEDLNSNLWTSTFNGLHKYDRESDSFNAIKLYDEDGELLENGYHIFFIEKKRFLWLKVEETIYVFDIIQRRIKKKIQTKGVRFAVKSGIDGQPKQIIACPWIESSGFEIINLLNDTITKTNYLNQILNNKKIEINSAQILGNTDLLLYSNQGLIYWEKNYPEKINLIPLEENSNYSVSKGIEIESNKFIVPINKYGIYIFDALKKEFLGKFRDYDFLKDSNFLGVHFDKNHLWVSKHGQEPIVSFPTDSNKFLNVFQNIPVPNPRLLSIIEDKLGKTWFALGNDGLYSQNNEGKRDLKNTKIFINATDLSEDANGNIWSLGGHQIYKQTNEEKWEIIIKEPSSSFSSIVHINDERKFIIKNSRLLELVSDEKKWNLRRTDIIKEANKDIVKIFAGTSQFYYFPFTFSNLKVLSKKNFSLFHDFTTNERIYDVWEDIKRRKTWLATSKGLAFFNWDNSSVIEFVKNDNLTNQNIFNIEGDNSHRLWMVNKQQLIFFNPDSEDCHIFHEDELAAGTSFSLFSDFTDSKGNIYFGTNNGALYFNPDSIKPYIFEPPISIETININNAPIKSNININTLKKLKLNYDDNNIKIKPLVTSYYLNKYNKIHYRMNGYDDDWRQIKNGEAIEYYRLNPKNYRLEMYGVNANGIRGETRTLQINISPPWYNTWWAYLLFLTIIILTFYTIYQFLLTQRLKEAEAYRLKELDQIKTALYTNITHEFRTPLTIILGMADPIKEKPKKGYKEGLEMIRRSGQNLLNLVNQMLDLAKIESGNMQAKYVQANIVHYLQYIVESFQSYTDTKKIKLVFYNEINELVMDYDVDKLQTILVNLLSNAAKFTPEEGKIIVHLNQWRQQKEGAKPSLFCQIKIKDNGIGIDEKDLPHIFDRFYQIDDSSTRSTGGTGIGLALTKELVELMKGTIAVDSQLNKGTEFTILLPISRTAPLAKDYTQENLLATFSQSLTLTNDESKEVQEENDGRPLILIIEDNLDVITYLQSCLEGGYRTAIALDGQAGIEKALALIPDIVITDVMMPRKNGYEVCEYLKQDERSSHIPIIMLTAKAQIENKITGLSKGADAYLSKPFHQKELNIRLEQLLLQRKRLQKYYSQTNLSDVLPEIKDPFIEKVIDLIEVELSADFNLDKFCQSLAMSRSQVYRKIKAITGYSTTIYIRHIRLKNAHRLLKSTKLSISEIAYQVGFKNPAFFSTCFLEVYQQTPSEVRG